MLGFLGPLIGGLSKVPWGKIFGGGGGKGLDPTMLALGGMGMFGGDDGPQKLNSFRGTAADPVKSLEEVLNAARKLGLGIQERSPRRAGSSFVQQGPGPVQIPGLPFQIGGGLGTDPALADPSLLQSDPREVFKYSPFTHAEGEVPRGKAQPRTEANAPKLRSPNG